MIRRNLQSFFDFVREQGIVGLAIGIMLGGAVTKVVTSLVTDVVNPLLSIVFGATANLKELSFSVRGVDVHYGNFLNSFSDFLVIAAVVYFLIRLLRVDIIDKKKSSPKPPLAPLSDK